MTNKETRTFSLDPENDKMCENHDNASALVNDLLTQYRKGANRQSVAIDLQIEQKQRELEAKENETERIEQDLSELRQIKAAMGEQDDAELDSARDALADVSDDPTNPGVKNWADKLGMTPTELLDEL